MMDPDERALVERRATVRDTPTRAVLIGLLTVGLTILAVELAYVLLLAFAGLVLAVVLRHAAGGIADRTPVPLPWAMVGLVVGATTVALAFALSVGPQIASELVVLADELPQTFAELRLDLSEQAWGRALIERVADGVQGRSWNVFGTVTGAVSIVFGLIANVLIVGSIAVFLAANPAMYREGALRLLPAHRRARVGQVFDEIGRSLSWWLAGQLFAMAVVAVLMTLGLWAIGVPLAIALGVIAGVTNIIPYLGPYLGGAPAVLIAFANEPRSALWTMLLIVGVQQLEGSLITPLIQQRAAALPAALVILAVIASGVLFGLLGVLLAAPLLIVVLTSLRMIVVEDRLDGTPTKAA